MGKVGEILDSQHDFFSAHPFPGLDLQQLSSIQQFVYTLEKNELYRKIKKTLKSGNRLLDAACGTGEFTTYLSINSGAVVVGMDFSANTVKWANGVKERFGVGCELSFIEEDVFKCTPEKYGYFDHILAMGLFTSIPDEEKGMRQLCTILEPGGLVVFGFFDPVGRAYMRLKRWMLHSISSQFQDQDAICKKVLLEHIIEKNEIIWNINQLTENVLNYHKPSAAIAMMERCGLAVTDCFPKLKLFGNILPDELSAESSYKQPLLQFPGQLNWVKSGTEGYYVLVGKKVG